MRLGIDLGTTNTVLAVEDHVVALGENGASTLPSVVAFLPNGRRLCGESARRRRVIDPSNTIFSSKRLIGLPFSSSRAQEFAARYPMTIVEGPNDEPVFETRAGRFSPVDIAAIVLDEIRSRGEHADLEVDAVITVPSSFREVQRDATRRAAREAGLGEVVLVDEPLATAYAYRSDPDVSGTVAVYDLGGGTFDVSIVECGHGGPNLLAKSSDPYLGGDDVDRAIADWVAEEVLKQHNWDLTNYNEIKGRLLAESERAKVRLSSRHETVVDVSQVDPDCPVAAEGVVLRRDVVERLTAELVRRTFVTCDEALRGAGLRPGDLGAVILAGGSTHLPVVRAGVEAYFGRAPRADVEPTEVVARGASLVRSDGGSAL